MKQRIVLLMFTLIFALHPAATYANGENANLSDEVILDEGQIDQLADGQNEEDDDNPVSDNTLPDDKVSDEPITMEELVEGAEVEGLTENRHFGAPSDAEAPSTKFEGTLELAGAQMGMSSEFDAEEVHGKDTTLFPDVSIAFITVDDQLVPTTQDVIPNGTLEDTESYWDMIVQPGRVWSNPDQDNDWNRASFPFSLVNRIEGETHTGIAMFLYKEDEVSHVRFQIVAQTGPFDVTDYFNAWGVTEASYEPGGIDNLEEHKNRYLRQVESRFPTAPLSDLEEKVGADKLANFEGTTEAEEDNVLRTGLFYDGTLYQSPCQFAAGSFPYCDEVRYGVWSVTKSAIMNVAMLRLAEKYGAGLLDEKIADYVPIPESQEGWDDVTYLDLANMAAGRGATEDDPTCYLCDYDRWYLAPSKDEKIAEALDYPRIWEPGTKYNYRDQDAFLLSVALEEYLRSKEGDDASLDDMLMEEVYEPIGIYYAPANYTIADDGSSEHIRGDFGYYPTMDDQVKIALLYQNHGKWDGNQILNRELVDSILPQQGTPERSLPKEDEQNKYGTKYYLMNWHIEPYQSSEGCELYLPKMHGYGGNDVILMPHDVIGLRVANALDESEKFESTVPQAEVGDQLVSFCEDSGGKLPTTASHVPTSILIGLIITAAGAYLLFFRKKQA